MAKNFSPVLVHDPIADAQAQTGPFSHLLGGKERIEDALGVRDAVALVAKRDLDKTSDTGGHDLNTRGTGSFSHRIVSIIKNVEKHLLQLVGIADHVRQFMIELLDYFHAVALEVVCPQLHGPAQDSVQLYGPALRRHLSSEAEQVLHNLLCAL